MSSGSRIILWDCQRMAKQRVLGKTDGRPGPRLSWGWIQSLVFSPDGKTLGGMQGVDIIRWDVATGKKQKQFRPGSEMVEGGIVFSPGGRHLVAGGKLLDLATGKAEPFLADGTNVRVLAFAPDGQTAAAAVYSKSGGAPAIVVYEGRTRRPRFRFEGHRRGINELVFSADGQLLVSGGEDGRTRRRGCGRRRRPPRLGSRIGGLRAELSRWATPRMTTRPPSHAPHSSAST
jgi:WD40 repeat protein